MSPTGSLVRGLLAALLGAAAAPAQVPHNQDRVPNQPYPPHAAIERMTVPPGFSVELVAAEPDIVNPIAMAFDEKGRIWITESLEYPRLSAGVGRDRIKVLEDTDRDGAIDKVTVFAEDLNIPSGIAVGHGGVWVANAPDLLFMRDTDGDLVADEVEVIATGFGRDDVHELPNSLTWGPDGYLYGLNGVFNRCRVTQDLDRDGRPDGDVTWRFTCAVFRIDPRTRRFSLFCEGTSNPWGLAFDGEGSLFASACVIDHLWHLVETGYYERQGGPYPPFTWKLGSIVDHAHQKAAYCGITWFDSPAYPAEYRGVLFMGNIHGNCLNSDLLERRGSSYRGLERPDFLSVDDSWFMPVAQKTGPDGCLYVLDWYDRYHCYQDARRDPEGIDRLRGRLYRIRYGDAPPTPDIDFAAESDEQLIELLGNPNVFVRRTAQRLLSERDRDASRAKLETLVLNRDAARKVRLHALWTMVSTGRLNAPFHESLLATSDATLRAWGVRAAGNFGRADNAIRQKIAQLAADPSPDVRLQVAIAARKIAGVSQVRVLVDVLAHSDDDDLVPAIVWQNLHPLLDDGASQLLAVLREYDLERHAAIAELMPRVTERLLFDMSAASAGAVADLFELIVAAQPRAARRCLETLAEMIGTGQLDPAETGHLRVRLMRQLNAVLDGPPGHELFVDAAATAASWGDDSGINAAREILADRGRSPAARLAVLEALAATGDATVLEAAIDLLQSQDATPRLVAGALGVLGKLEDDNVATRVLRAYPRLDAGLRTRALELLTQRTNWSRVLVDAVQTGDLPAAALNGNQVRLLHTGADDDLAAAIRAIWGRVRTERNPDREHTTARVRSLVRLNQGDPSAGREIFGVACAQCHTIWGQGSTVGPDLTNNGRGSFEQLLSNVLDPSLVVGDAYQLRTVHLRDGRVMAGMLTEENERRLTIQMIGGQTETIARRHVDRVEVSPISFMPEGLENTMGQQELIDLFAFLLLDRPPDDPAARTIAGYTPLEPRESADAAQFDELLAAVAPGFHVEASGEGGVALLAEHFGRAGVVRTHPVERGVPCVLERRVTLPADRQTSLEISVSHQEAVGDDRGWELVVLVDGESVHRSVVDGRTARDGWVDLSIDLSAWKGQRVDIELHNHPDDWAWEFGYWGRVALVSR